jgi:hypothetical protein
MSEEQPSTDSTDKAISDRLHSIFPNQATANRVISMVASKRPIGWGRNSGAPYYTEKNGLWIRGHIDKMIETGQNIVYRYDTFCGDKEQKMSKMTLYNMVHQSLLYLLECLDNDKKYATWYESVFKNRKHGVGIVISFKPGHGPQGGDSPLPQPELVLPKEQMPKWKAKLEEWLEGDDKEPFIQERLALTPDEVRELKNQFVGLEGVAASITSNAVKVIRIAE